MTASAARTKLLEGDSLYITDEEMIRRIGAPADLTRAVIRELEAKHNFPRKEKLWGDRRYWPAIKAYFDKRHGLISDDRRG